MMKKQWGRKGEVRREYRRTKEIEGLAPDDLDISRLGVKLSVAHQAELRDRVHALFEEFAAKDADEDGAPISLFFASHPDLPRSARGL